MPPSAPVEEEDSGPLNLSTPYPITLSRVALHNVGQQPVRKRHRAARYYVAVDTKKMPPSAPVEEEDSGPLNLSTPYPITLSRVALHNV
ncbi:hypothetical protein CKQ90_32705, partial [Klebsiella pneumoniae]